MILPLAKLGTLALKTFCKPIANRLKKEAGVNPKFRQFIVNIAQANHRISTNIQRRIYGHATNVEVRPLNEENAVQAAADLIGELFVFSVAGSALIFEVQRNARSEAHKEEARKQEIEASWVHARARAAIRIHFCSRSECTSSPEAQFDKASLQRPLPTPLCTGTRLPYSKSFKTAIKQREEDLAKELELLKQKLNEIEQSATKKGLGILNFRHGNVLEVSKPVAAS